MTTFANQLKAEIARIAKKSGKAETAELKKASSKYRSEIAELKRRIAALESSINRVAKQAGKAAKSGAAANTEEKDKLRFRQDGFITLRKKLNLSANEMGQLLGVSGQSIYKWEQGKAKPRASQLPAIAAARKMGKKEVMAKLSGSGISE